MKSLCLSSTACIDGIAKGRVVFYMSASTGCCCFEVVKPDRNRKKGKSFIGIWDSFKTCASQRHFLPKVVHQMEHSLPIPKAWCTGGHFLPPLLPLMFNSRCSTLHPDAWPACPCAGILSHLVTSPHPPNGFEHLLHGTCYPWILSHFCEGGGEREVWNQMHISHQYRFDVFLMECLI